MDLDTTSETGSPYAALSHIADATLRLDDPLARYTAARLGGRADAVIVVRSIDALREAFYITQAHGWPTRILGGGANVLISDRGFRGVVIVNHANAITFAEDASDGTVIAESGATMTHLARLSMARGLAGFEWAVSVPGTVGGGVVNNAGAHGGAMADSLTAIDIAVVDLAVADDSDHRAIQQWPAAKLDYHYRESALKHAPMSFVVLRAYLQFNAGADPAALQAKADGFIAHRKQTQPPGASLGSMFKNPPGDYAGRLIEAAGLKGARHGGVQISPVHGNFFVNTGGGTADDYVALIRLAQTEVKSRFGVTLDLEVELFGDWGTAESTATARTIEAP